MKTKTLNLIVLKIHEIEAENILVAQLRYLTSTQTFRIIKIKIILIVQVKDKCSEIVLSYKYLPQHLTACLLHTGAFLAAHETRLQIDQFMGCQWISKTNKN